jgi:hypothetical protein
MSTNDERPGETAAYVTVVEAADLFLRMWDAGGRDEVVLLIQKMGPLRAAVSALLAGSLFERNVADWSDLVELLAAAR